MFLKLDCQENFCIAKIFSDNFFSGMSIPSIVVFHLNFKVFIRDKFSYVSTPKAPFVYLRFLHVLVTCLSDTWKYRYCFTNYFSKPSLVGSVITSYIWRFTRDMKWTFLFLTFSALLAIPSHSSACLWHNCPTRRGKTDIWWFRSRNNLLHIFQ